MSNIILVPLDGSTLADAAVPHAVELARSVGATLRLIRVHEPMAPMTVEPQVVVVPDPRIEAEIEATQRAWLDARGNSLRVSSGLPVTTEFRIGRAGDEVVRAAADCNAKTIVCTTHGSGGWTPRWIGSVTDFVLRHAASPVLAMSVAGAEKTTRPESVLVLLDGSETAASILPEVAAFAKAFGARIELFRVVAPPWLGDSEVLIPPEVDRFGIDVFAENAKRELDAVADDLRGKGLTVTSTVEVRNGVTRRILDYIETSNPDVVALATHGRGIGRLLFGSVADKVLRSGARPMLCVSPRRAAVREAIQRLESRVAIPQTTVV
jgi:nucleotide-binding universal stress UspA family protein